MAHLPTIVSTAKMDKVLILSIQVVLIILFGVFTVYDPAASPKENSNTIEVATSYPMFQDIHVMIFVGFGFLMTFLRRYGFSSVGFNFLLASLVIQWAILCRGFFAMEDSKVKIGLINLMGADIAAAAVLISMGALVGRTTYLQLLIMGIIEIAVYATNEFIVLDLLKVTDVGGSIVVHTFGAYFGLAVSFALRPRKTGEEQNVTNSLEGSSYNSDLFAMIGTTFLFIFWPSFNGGLVQDDQQYRAIINTYLSLSAATVSAFMVSNLVSHGKFDMVHVQNSTLAGGVAVGAVCNLMIQPFGALLIGAVAGTFSVLGYRYLSPLMSSKVSLLDTCGVNNLHGMPGIFSGILSAIFALLATEDVYKRSLYEVFPAMAPTGEPMPGTEEGLGRTNVRQFGFQLLALVITLAISIVSGTITGFVIKSPLFGSVPDGKKYDDEHSWEIPTSEDQQSVIMPKSEDISSVVVHRKSDTQQIQSNGDQ